MDTQENEYELGTLEDNILDRDESQARQGGSRGDERRWMILGGAGTLALLTAIVAAVSLGGASEPRKLSASLRGPARDLSALSAHVQSSVPATPSPEAVAAKVTPKARVARAQPAAPQPVAPAPVAVPPEARKPTAAPVTHAAVADTTATSFANLPTVSAIEEDVADADEPAEVVPTNFEQDEDPFAEDESADEDEDDASEDSQDDDASDEAEATPEEPAPAEAPAEAPAPAADVAVAVPAPTPA